MDEVLWKCVQLLHFDHLLFWCVNKEKPYGTKQRRYEMETEQYRLIRRTLVEQSKDAIEWKQNNIDFCSQTSTNTQKF